MAAEKFNYLPFDLVDRKNWGALDPAEEDIPLPGPAAYVIHTYTDTEPCFEKGQCTKMMRNIQLRDLSLGLSDIKYNFVIGGDSSVYVGRGWTNLPDMNEDFPQLYERSIEIAHIGFPGEPTDEMKHVVKLLLRFGVAKKHLRSTFKLVEHFHEIIKEEEHYEMDATGEMEMTCYKKQGVETEKDESDDYKVMTDLSPRGSEHILENDPGDDLPAFEKAEYVDVADGIRVDTSLIDSRNDPIPIKHDSSTLEPKHKKYIY